MEPQKVFEPYDEGKAACLTINTLALHFHYYNVMFCGNYRPKITKTDTFVNFITK